MAAEFGYKKHMSLAFTVSSLSQFAFKPTKNHIRALKQVLRYLKGTSHLKLTYESRYLAGYSDADYAGDRSDRKSTSGFIFHLATNAICWRAIKQRCTATSTVEALSTAAKQHIRLLHALEELRLSIPAALSTDSDGSIDLTINTQISDRSKHIEVAYHHVRDLVESGKLSVLLTRQTYVLRHCQL